MTELDKNLEEVTNKALETGEKVVTVECPCCSKIFYATESEATYQAINRNEEIDFGMDMKGLSGKQLGRKCPFCGFAGGMNASDFFKLGRGSFIKEEIKAVEEAEKARDESRTPWAEINNMGVFKK